MNRLASTARLLTCLCITLTLLSACEPKDRRPGAWLQGDTVTTLPDDWSFVVDHPEIFIETRPWYGIPFSVTTVIGTRNGKLYVPSIYDEELPFPGSKYWNSVIGADPQVRVKIGKKLYEMTATHVQDLQEYRDGVAALADKYDSWRGWLDDPDSGPHFVIIRLDPR